ELSASPQWRGNVLVPFVRKRHGPQLFARLAVKSDDRALGHRNNLLSAGEIDQHRRSIAWSKSAPLPFSRAGRGIEREHLPAVNVAADLDHETSRSEEHTSELQS